ncbi:ferulic acid Esterase/Feruloyl esterase [Apiospora phragmitis]|uniref:Carboxylic ester hydrolase n=1 Tax=Apiospora phragmitis TaxID=2905665 RepID=A0ABR1TB68_9PEZI
MGYFAKLPRFPAILLVLVTCVLAATSPCSVDSISTTLAATEGAHVLEAHQISSNGTFGQAGDIAYPANATNLPSLCLTWVNVTSSLKSSYTFGLMLPDVWNARFLAVGNGGFSGGVNWQGMGVGARYGFATMSTDTGHNSTGQDMTLHGSTVVAKKIVEGYYAGTAALERSYYSGCSTGGRQGIKSAQDYPEDFDGILAGAPAWWPTRQQLWQLKVGAINLPEDGPGYIPPTMFSGISDEVLQQCDESDGIADGIIMDPMKCNLRLEKLLCRPSRAGNSSSTCLTKPQLQTLQQLYLPLIEFDADVHKLDYLYPSFGVGSELQMPASFRQDNAPSLYGTEYAAKYVFGDAAWDWRTNFSYATFVGADRLSPGDVNAVRHDLSEFHGRGVKLITYHGYADGLIPPGASRMLYDEAYAAMAATQGVELDDFYRLLFVPGMQHCGGGVYDAPWYFGGSGQGAILQDLGRQDIWPLPGYGDGRHDALVALMEWVERGQTLESIVATKFRDDTAEKGIVRQRPICKYPGQAHYTGSGDIHNATNWACKS